ncbi:MAG TPA: RtcB family protein [Candidatus Wallbacteria bacterium]|nr:RtcB family protein [Candidatus Wallbacteria bacterium]
MIEIRGKYNTAKVFTGNIEAGAREQIKQLCDQGFCEKSVIRIMPDVHAGAGCTIGTTMTVKNTVVPNLVGVDIGCGMETVKLAAQEIDLEKLDRIIYQNIPSGFDVRSKAHPYSQNVELENLRCKKHMDLRRAALSVGTLGGGNHFIEAARDEEGFVYIVVHSGSRHLGKEAAEYYQKKAYEELTDINAARREIAQELKAEGRFADIEDAMKKASAPKIIKSLAYLKGGSFEDYINDMKIIQAYADNNRKAMADIIIETLKLPVAERFTTIHNYIDTDSMILRKGAISARKNETVLIPMNMRDGSLICIGKGNPDWNFSAPHGAGRIMSRTAAKHALSMDEFKRSMKGIYTTTLNKSTLDEAPMAYKPMDEIIENIKDTVEIIRAIKPVYNFKAAE